MKKKILLGLLGLFVVIQFFQIDKSPIVADPSLSLKASANPPGDVLQMLENACFDCHSNDTEYPWYASIQPVGWFLRSHVRGAKMHLNFSEFANMNVEDRQHALKECVEEIEEGAMPMKSFVWLHPEAKLSETDKAKLINWLKNPVPNNIGMVQ